MEGIPDDDAKEHERQLNASGGKFTKSLTGCVGNLYTLCLRTPTIF